MAPMQTEVCGPPGSHPTHSPYHSPPCGPFPAFPRSKLALSAPSAARVWDSSTPRRKIRRPSLCSEQRGRLSAPALPPVHPPLPRPLSHSPTCGSLPAFPGSKLTLSAAGCRWGLGFFHAAPQSSAVRRFARNGGAGPVSQPYPPYRFPLTALPLPPAGPLPAFPRSKFALQNSLPLRDSNHGQGEFEGRPPVRRVGLPKNLVDPLPTVRCGHAVWTPGP